MKKILIISGVILVVVASGVALYSVYTPEIAESPDINESKPELIFNNGGGSPDGVSVTPKPENKTAPLPKYKGQALDYLGDPQILAKYPEEFVKTKRSQLANTIALITENPEVGVNWTDVGIIKKNFDNFIGARDAWEYVKLLNPKNALAYYNLGKLYSAYMQDNRKAETNFLEAVRLDEASDYPYLGLAEFYRDFYKEKYDQVDDVLLAGLKNLPTDPNLIIQLAFYYKDGGDKENAIKYFEQFLKLTGLTGDQQRAVEVELSALRS